VPGGTGWPEREDAAWAMKIRDDVLRIESAAWALYLRDV